MSAPTSLPGPVIRPATVADLPLIWRREFDHLLELEPTRADSWLAETDGNLRLWIEQLERTSVIEVAGQPAGYAIWMGEGDEAVLITLQVFPHFRRQGLGRQLFERFVADATAAGHRRKALGVRRGNPAESLYVSAGFRHTHDEGGYRFFSCVS